MLPSKDDGAVRVADSPEQSPIEEQWSRGFEDEGGNTPAVPWKKQAVIDLKLSYRRES